MRKIYTYILYFIFIVCSSCNESESVTLIDLTNNVTDSICTLSEITDSIVYYPLTTNKKPQDIELLLNYIGVFIDQDSVRMQLFDRKNLNLLKTTTLGEAHQTIGYHPMFKFSNTSFPFNEETKFITTYRSPKGRILPIMSAKDGICRDSILEPKGYHTMFDFWGLNDSIFVKDYLVLQEVKYPTIKWYDRNLTLIKEDILPDSITRSNYHSMSGLSCPFNLLGNKIYFHTDLMPTIYEVSSSTSPKAIYRFKMGTKTPKLQKLKSYKKADESPYILIADSKISHHYIWGEYCFRGNFFRVLFNRNSFKKWIIPTNMKLMSIRKNHSKIGLTNDLDGGLDFWPRRISKNGEIYTWYNKEDLKAKVSQSNPKQMKNPEAARRLKEMLNNLPEEVNYVIAVLKEKN